jgi:hypothetical protein
MGRCRASVEISSETDRWQALSEWDAGWGKRLELDAKSLSLQGSAQAIGRWVTASNKWWARVNYLPIILVVASLTSLVAVCFQRHVQASRNRSLYLYVTII